MPKTCTSCGKTYPDTMVFCPTDGTSLRADEVAGDLIGTVIADRYLVNQLLGEGGMGRVYLASHVRLPQKAAIKVLHQDMVKDTGAVARFNREAANAARIEHDRVARVFDFGETADGLVYLAMEYVPGKTLRELLDAAPRMAPARAANIVYQVAEGLDAAHRLNIVHRDLKPDNILVITDETGADRCKVVDFGIAKVTNSSETQLTQAGMLVGTPEFMSPEQVLGETLDGRSDVYALALVAYEMFTGGLPFEGNTPERKLTARLIQDPKPLAATAPDVAWPEALQATFDRALEREPDARTATALEFADALVAAVELWLGGSVLRARTPMSTPAIVGAAKDATGALGRPTPSSTTLPAAPASSTASTAAPSSRGTPGAGTSASKVAIPEPVARKTPVAAIAGIVLLVAAAGGYFALQGPKASAGTVETQTGAPGTGTRPVTSFATGQTDSTRQVADVATLASAPRRDPRGSDADSTSPTRPAASVAPPATTPAVAAPPNATNEADAAAARRTLDALRNTLASSDGDEMAVATRMLPQLLAVLPRLGSATDSTYAYLALVFAHGLMERPDRACEPFRQAKRLARTADQRTTLASLDSTLTCAP